MKKDKILALINKITQSNYPDSEVYLFGSQARGNPQQFSDWDLLILLNETKLSFSQETKLMDEFYDLELETGQIFSPLIYTKKEWVEKYVSSSLFDNISRDSIRLQ